ncbi:class 3 adenylate cyclase [Streptomyces sp. 2132.2]|uniref:hypothetical protein n=1 Tax=Streptomyces sp. 2132.2 TaxID=2485161 RepID=UPI000F4AB6F7|nr:hypothetical protein [Streptomyces sp. 2132.2]ROQ89014.1 class 3 adenylate cyclase [Streptomyces sp. 2132.2]
MRELARALGTGVVSSSRIHDAFTKPRLPTWGLVQVLVVELANRTPGADATTEVKRLHTLWDEAAQAEASPQVGVELRPRQDVTSPHVPAAGSGPQRTLLLVDLEGFNKRNEVEQAYLRRSLYSLVDRVATAAGAGSGERQQSDLGDAVMELIDDTVPVVDLLRALLQVLPADLNAYNRVASGSARIRLRLVLATVRVDMRERGWAGDGEFVHAYRLLDADLLRTALRERMDDYALCVSAAVYQSTVRHNHGGVPAQEFHEVAVPTKDGVLQAWLHLPVRLN